MPRGNRRTFRLGCGPMWAKAKVKSHEWSYRGRARFTCKKWAKARLKIPATSPWTLRAPTILGDGKLGRRFYVICEANRSFRAISAGHGGGRDLKGIVDLANGRQCAKNFSNAMDSKLTAGGPYMTANTARLLKDIIASQREKTQFWCARSCSLTAKAKPQTPDSASSAGIRPYCWREYVFEKSGQPIREPRRLRSVWKTGELRRRPQRRLHQLVAVGRPIIPMLKDNPTTLYIYPEFEDIDAVAQAVAAGSSPSRAGLYWNASCLKEIGSPKFWPKETLEPILAQYKKDHPEPPPRPTPICKEP